MKRHLHLLILLLTLGVGWSKAQNTNAEFVDKGEGRTVTIASDATDGLNGVSFTGTDSFNLTATLGTASRTVNLRIPHVFEITTATQLAYLSHILSEQVEWNDEGYPWVDASGEAIEDGNLIPPYAEDAYFKLMNDISLSAICGEGIGNWQPIGYDDFMGHFNGNGCTISGLYINNSLDHQALFGRITNGSISNLTVEGSVTGGDYIAGIASIVDNATISNCHNAVNVTSKEIEYAFMGGVCCINEGVVINSYNSGILADGSIVGGICYYNNSKVSNCYNIGLISGSEVYGIAFNGWSASITDCFNVGTLSGSRVYGIGYNEDGALSNCYNTGALFGDEYVAAICNSEEDGGGSGPSKGNSNVTNCFYDKQICTATDADATGLLTSEMTSGNSIFGVGNSNWVYTENFYPLLAGMDETDAAQVAAEPLFLSATDNAGSVIGSVSVNGTSGITWTATTNPSGILTVDGNTYTFTAEGEAEMRCSKNGIEKLVSLYHPEVKVITTAAQLAELATGVNSGEEFSITGLGTFPLGGEDTYIVLGNDINLNGSAENQWTPIGWYDYNNDIEHAFLGYFNGNGKTISGLYIDNENGIGLGLFGEVYGCTILNLAVEGEIVGSESVGGICGMAYESSFENCVNTVLVTGNESVGGICGTAKDVDVMSCINLASVSALYQVAGGICGILEGGSANNCYNVRTVYGGEYDALCGGICGFALGTVSNSYNAGMVVGDSDCGPICGEISGTLTNCYFDTDMCSGFEDYEDENVSGAPSSDFTSGILPPDFDDEVWYAVPGSYPRLIDNDHVMAMPVMAYEEEEVVRDEEPFGGWYLVASPMVNNITPSVNNGLLNDPEGADFDLYGFNIRETGEEWCNVKDESNEIVVMNGKGYLVANGKNTIVRFTGDFHAEEEVVVSGISGWGLVGNPLGVVATVSCDFYKMNANHSELVLCEAGTTVNPGEAIFVNNSSVTFTPTNASAPVSSPMLNLNLSNAENGLIDRASIRFGEGKSLDKFMLDEANTQLYMLQGEKRYAVVATNATAGEMYVNFKAEKQGSYTLSVEMKDVALGNLHLIDKFTGADIDLLATPNYTFMASPSDNVERFTVVIK